MIGSPIVDSLARYFEDQHGISPRDPQAVLSHDASLESWLFISAQISDGPRHGEVGTWALPGFNFTGDPAPLNLLVPANDAAATISPINNIYADGVDEWMDLDGARESQACLSQ